MVELRKRPAPKEAPAPAAKRSASKPRSKTKQIVEKTKELITGESSTTGAAPAVPDSETAGDTGKVPETVGAGTAGVEPSTDKIEESTAVPAESSAVETKPSVPAVDDTAAPAGGASAAAAASLTGADVGKTLSQTALSAPTLTHAGATSTLSTLLQSSTTGVVIFTYPKASTPGCTNQACLFRDNYDFIRDKGYDVYGLSNDSEKANTGFKTKHKLQYDMLCDSEAKVTSVLGMKKPGNAKGTIRGVVVLGKEGKVEVWMQGGPPKTLDAVRAFLA